MVDPHQLQQHHCPLKGCQKQVAANENCHPLHDLGPVSQRSQNLAWPILSDPLANSVTLDAYSYRKPHLLQNFNCNNLTSSL